MASDIRPTLQRGVVMPLVVIALAALIGMAGLGMELGLTFLVNTRLQNALDAGALGGAKTLKVNAGNTDEAREDALEAFNFYADQIALGDATPSVEFSPTLDPFTPGGSNPRYIRLRLTGVSVPLRLVRVLPGVGDSLSVGGSAVAGPIELTTAPGDEVCNIVPMVVSADPDADTDCTDGSCFGYSEGEEVQLKMGSEDDGETSGPGNYNLIRLGCGSGADCLRRQLAGEFSSCLSLGDTITTEPGNTVGPVAQGLNTRLGIYHGPVSADQYPPDAVTTEGIDFSTYENRLSSGQYDHAPPGGVPHRRMLPTVFADFSDPSGGVNDLTVLGVGCFFMTRRVSQSGDQTVTGEFTLDCNPDGPSTPVGPGADGFFKIILYKDPDSSAS